MGRPSLTKSSRRPRRRLADVLPLPEPGLEVNFCRNTNCQNFGRPPDRNPSRKHNLPAEALLSRYILFKSKDETVIKCAICGRTSSMLSNAALVAEISRLRTANGVLMPEGCPTKDCENHTRPAVTYPAEYYAHGRTRSGTERLRCRRCLKTLTVGERRPRRRPKKATAPVNKDIVLDLVNRGALRAIMRKCGITADTLYDRIDFIHERMIAFEAFKLKKLRERKGKHRRHFALGTDMQDHQVNWGTRFRRYGIRVSAVCTADNYTGFVFRTDVNFDPTTGDVVPHFERLLKIGDFKVEGSLGLSHRYALPSFFRAVRFSLEMKRNKTPEDSSLLAQLYALAPDLGSDTPTNITNPIKGVMISNMYTAIAHYMLIAETLPADADVHLMTDPDGNFVAAVPVGLRDLIKNEQADLTYVLFDKTLKTPEKQQRVGEYKIKHDVFAASCPPEWDATKIRHAFIDQYKHPLPPDYKGIRASWWKVPVQTMYEPDRCVGIFHQRTAETDDEHHDRFLELLDRSSLHAVDSFFNVMRQRVSFFHRAGLQRSSESFYNAFQPYNPDMVQKIVDIARVYFNWVEPRPFRLAEKFEAKIAKEHSSNTEMFEKLSDQNERKERRENKSTPAMRMFLAKNPMRLEAILYTDWKAKLFAVPKARRSRVTVRKDWIRSGGNYPIRLPWLKTPKRAQVPDRLPVSPVRKRA
jgi:hypothetical protein